MDRALVAEAPYRLETTDGRPQALLHIGCAVVLNTSDAEAEKERLELGDPLQSTCAQCFLRYYVAKELHRHVFRPVVDSSDALRKDWLN